MSRTIQGAGGIGGLLARSSGYSSGSWSTHNFYHADGNGNITMLVNNSQSSVAIYKYNPFGGTISSSGSLASANTYRFSSKEYHANPGLYYYGYRFHDPNLQRWLTQDPYSEPGFHLASGHSGGRAGRAEVNQYLFVDGNPIGDLDFWGLITFKGCAQSVVDEFLKGLKERCNKALNKKDANGNDCFDCMGESKLTMRSFCQQINAYEWTVQCVDASTNENCKNNNCASSPKKKLTYLCLPRPSNCANIPLGCTALHEAAHAIGGVGGDLIDKGNKKVLPFDPRAYMLANCADCPESDVSFLK